ncbi:hypothetical protein L7F22_025750 [Adiantum nelumboides]|nr:hypothetical protein [Adiantum nelumboides]
MESFRMERALQGDFSELWKLTEQSMGGFSSSSTRDKFKEYIINFEATDQLLEGPQEPFTQEEIAEVKKKLQEEQADKEREIKTKAGQDSKKKGKTPPQSREPSPPPLSPPRSPPPSPPRPSETEQKSAADREEKRRLEKGKGKVTKSAMERHEDTNYTVFLDLKAGYLRQIAIQQGFQIQLESPYQRAEGSRLTELREVSTDTMDMVSQEDEWDMVIQGLHRLKERFMTAEGDNQSLRQQEERLRIEHEAQLKEIQVVSERQTALQVEVQSSQKLCSYLAIKCQQVEKRAADAEEENKKLAKTLAEAEKERANLTLQLSYESKEAESMRNKKEKAEVAHEAAKDEIIELKDQLEVKERTVQRLRGTSSRARTSIDGSSQEVKTLEEQLKEMQKELSLERRQRVMIAESSMAAEKKLEDAQNALKKDNYDLKRQLEQLSVLLIKTVEDATKAAETQQRAMEELWKQVPEEPVPGEGPAVQEGINLDLHAEMGDQPQEEIPAGTSQEHKDLTKEEED